MSRKGNDLVRKYLWNAAKSAIRHNPAVKALYQRLRGRGVRGDVALGHGMRKLLHLVFAVWRTASSFDPRTLSVANAAAETARTTKKPQATTRSVSPESKVVTAVDSQRKRQYAAAQATLTPPAPSRAANDGPADGIDYAVLRSQLSMAEVLDHLSWLRCV